RRFASKFKMQNSKCRILLLISLAFILGGAVRILANEDIFRFFQMEHLWSNEPFFIYIYKLLGGFVLWMGILLFIASKNVSRYRGVVLGSVIGLGLFFVVSLVTGFSAGLRLLYFIVDSIFSLFLVVVLYLIYRNA
ncbi:MAG: hypothetical protein WBD28_01650, partial [Candidatus Zixiibacteriota bacterium]